MILSPSQLASMKLGIHKGWQPVTHIPPRVEIHTALPPAAFSRIMATHRVRGYNDQYGDCVETGCCNVVQTLMARRGIFTALPDTLPLKIYSDVTGFKPNDPSTDQGTDPIAMFTWWQENPINGFKLKNYSLLDPQYDITMHDVISSTGCICAVVNLAVEQQNQREWSAAGTPGTWGQHFICIDQYDGPAGCTSWGEGIWIDRSFFTQGFVLQLYELDVIDG